ncbi:hypothetical protein THAOC_26825, partial [Thalassiosira oceanica]
ARVEPRRRSRGVGPGRRARLPRASQGGGRGDRAPSHARVEGEGDEPERIRACDMLVARGVDTRQPGHVPGHVDQSAGLRRAGLGGGEQEVSLKVEWLEWGVVVLKLVVVVCLIYEFVGTVLIMATLGGDGDVRLEGKTTQTYQTSGQEQIAVRLVVLLLKTNSPNTQSGLHQAGQLVAQLLLDRVVQACCAMLLRLGGAQTNSMGSAPPPETAHTALLEGPHIGFSFMELLDMVHLDCPIATVWCLYSEQIRRLALLGYGCVPGLKSLAGSEIQACAATSVFGSQLHASFWCRKRPIGFSNDLGSGIGSLPPPSTITASHQHDRIVSSIGDSSNKQGVSGNFGIRRLRKIRECQLDKSPLAVI